MSRQIHIKILNAVVDRASPIFSEDALRNEVLWYIRLVTTRLIIENEVNLLDRLIFTLGEADTFTKALRDRYCRLHYCRVYEKNSVRAIGVASSALNSKNKVATMIEKFLRAKCETEQDRKAFNRRELSN